MAAILIPIAALDDDYELVRYPVHPYANAALGAAFIGDEAIAAYRAGGGRAKSWTARLQIDGAMIDSAPRRGGARIAIDSAWRIGLEVNADAWGDDADGRDDDGRVASPERAGESLLTWRFAHSEHAQFRLGVGPVLRRVDGNTSAGVGLLYAAEFYPTRPLVLGGDLRCTSFGDDRVDGRFDVYAGLLVGGGLELQLGGEIAYSDHQIRAGPRLGVRWWF